jgi:hypothetical protein
MEKIEVLRIALAVTTFGIIGGVMFGILRGKWILAGFVSTIGLLATLFAS